jgi:hypothetical protein
VDQRVSAQQAIWGYLGATAAAWFAIWLLFFPGLVPSYFAWDVEPRAAQGFIGAGYLFRTLFFLNAAREGNWYRLRWMTWGNLVFTGVLLLATYWHADKFNWNPTRTPVAHLWIVLYIFEPVLMLYLVPRGIRGATAPSSGGPIIRPLRGFLVLVTGVLLMHGLLLVVNPEFAARRWPWELNPLDARIVGAWFLGWACWSGTMAFALDWDEIKRACQLFVINGIALLATGVALRDAFIAGRGTVVGYLGGLVVLTVSMAALYLVQERRRPAGTPSSA